MQLCKAQLETGETRVGAVSEGHVRFLDLEDYLGMQSLSDVLHSDNPAGVARGLIDDSGHSVPLKELTLLAPIDCQEVWAAGVTYKRSQEARERESAGAARFYDLVYSAARPELFLKATPNRVVGPGGRVRVRRDSRWSVPEPELALVLSPRLKVVGYTAGNDMSARDIEGENPLYLPQAKVYDHSCALGPVITLADAMPPLDRVTIRVTIERRGDKVFEGATSPAQMARRLDDLVAWLGRENSFPHGVILLTGTGVVPPDDFALAPGDLVTIDITGIGRLTNLVEQQA
ncbi:MAG TPA: fumarylacetoacetate hydrolase family protein [Gemmataceae bacterium]|jgi:2-dehydro-3-deoxy-D-arabinonate dehydratase|nr:fumarylacetoacetate hydrolase family protein [Gemmataceae bacterium]